jgi:hypothetical protein
MNDDRQYHAIRVNDHELNVVMPFGRLAEMVDDPDPPKPGSRRRKTATTPESDWQCEQRIRREQIQRPFAGTKKGNVPRYRQFIDDVIARRRYGDMPEIVLWAGPESLRVEDVPTCPDIVVVHIPIDVHMIAIDGETQLASRFDLLKQDARGSQSAGVTRIHHGVPMQAAQQIFFERNVRSITVPPAFAMMCDHTDVLTSEARHFAAMLGPDLVSVKQTNRLSLVTIRQGILWVMYRRTKEAQWMRRRAEFSELLSAAVVHITERLSILRPLLETESLLRRPAVFIACLDRRVRVMDIESISPDEPFWQGMRTGAEARTVAAVVDHIAQEPLPFADEVETETDGSTF